MKEITAGWVKELLPGRDPWGHKGTFGKVYCLCGSVGYTGAPVFAGRAAMRTGSGLVYLGVPAAVWQVTAVKSDEAMPFPLPDRDGKLSRSAEGAIRERIASCDAVLIGCGLGRSDESDQLVRRLLDMEKPLILDADGINALQHHINTLSVRRDRVTVLTPHEGEFVRVGGDLSSGRERAAREFALQHGIYLVLKGHRTIVAAPDGRMAVNTTGNAGMAKGGSGDMLSGIILALLAQGVYPFDAAVLGAYIHGAAGDAAARELSLSSMLASDCIAALPRVLRTLER